MTEARTPAVSVAPRRIVLQRPLVCVDLETTGTSRRRDRIVRIGLLKLFPDGRENRLDVSINPGIPIPPAATAVHGIRDADVAAAPRFAEVAAELHDWLEGVDMTGFNVQTFDLEVLAREMRDARHPLDLNAHAIVDVRRIDHLVRPRTLAHVYRDYFGKELDGAHSPLVDAQATVDLLHAQVARYSELAVTVPELAAQLRDPTWLTARASWCGRMGARSSTSGGTKGRRFRMSRPRRPTTWTGYSRGTSTRI